VLEFLEPENSKKSKSETRKFEPKKLESHIIKVKSDESGKDEPDKSSLKGWSLGCGGYSVCS